MTGNSDPEMSDLQIAQAVSGKWIASVLGALDNFSSVLRAQILETAGRACAHGPKSTVDLAQRLAKDVKDIEERLEQFRTNFPVPRHSWNVEMQNNQFQSLTFEYRSETAPCACPLVRTGTIAMNPALCECSHGWVKEHFEALLGQDVRVTVDSTVARGGDSCKYTIRPK
ncbi:MAG: hypothetical protein ACFFD8_11230 [Candidatus Thorarchaeota archaeon]